MLANCYSGFCSAAPRCARSARARPAGPGACCGTEEHINQPTALAGQGRQGIHTLHRRPRSLSVFLGEGGGASALCRVPAVASPYRQLLGLNYWRHGTEREGTSKRKCRSRNNKRFVRMQRAVGDAPRQSSGEALEAYAEKMAPNGRTNEGSPHGGGAAATSVVDRMRRRVESVLEERDELALAVDSLARRFQASEIEKKEQAAVIALQSHQLVQLSCALDSFLVVRSKLTLASGVVAVAHSVEGHPDAGPAATSAEDESFYSAAEMLASITD